jgi:hypothetical protein
VEGESERSNFGLAWLLLCIAFAAHITDEALTGFLDIYNATMLTMYGHFAWFPRMDMTFREWLIRLLVALAILFALTPFAYRNARWLRPIGYLFAAVMLLNGIGHTVATIAGQTVPSVHFARPAPGFYSSPLLLAGSVFLWICLGRSRKPNANRQARET